MNRKLERICDFLQADGSCEIRFIVGQPSQNAVKWCWTLSLLISAMQYVCHLISDFTTKMSNLRDAIVDRFRNFNYPTKFLLSGFLSISFQQSLLVFGSAAAAATAAWINSLMITLVHRRKGFYDGSEAWNRIVQRIHQLSLEFWCL